MGKNKTEPTTQATPHPPHPPQPTTPTDENQVHKGVKYYLSNTLLTLITVGVLIACVVALFEKAKEDIMIRESREEASKLYEQRMKDTCKEEPTTSCRVVFVSNSDTSYDPFTIHLYASEDFTETSFPKLAFPDLIEAPRESLRNKYVRLTIKEGKTTHMEIIGSEIEKNKAMDKVESEV